MNGWMALIFKVGLWEVKALCCIVLPPLPPFPSLLPLPPAPSGHFGSDLSHPEQGQARQESTPSLPSSLLKPNNLSLSGCFCLPQTAELYAMD